MTFEPDMSVIRPDRPGIRKVLGDLEAEIMEYVWEHAPEQGITVREVFEALYERRSIAYTTVMSTMARLAKKNYLRVEKRDQAYIYYARMTQEEFVSQFVGRLLKDLFLNFSGATLEGIKALLDPHAAVRAQQLLEEITQRRLEEEQ